MHSYKILNPPSSIGKMLGFLGPGFILSASIVGSGELIATTLLGAEAGFIAFWVILVSCLIKVGIQLEFGKNAIISGNKIMTEFNAVNGPRIRNSNWSVWLTFILTTLKVLQVGGMVGGAAIAFSMLFPRLPISVSSIIIGLSISLFIYRNYFKLIERISVIMVFGFTLFTLTSLVFLFFTPYSFTLQEVLTGLTFQLPKESLFVAIGAFGITGVASDEIIAYTYWCQEKGYAQYTGPNDGTEEWNLRAKGWIKVMYLDAFVAMCCYTLVTAAFYLLGAAVLNGIENTPEGNDLIGFLANIYTETLGPTFRIPFLIGAFIALYSSVFATLAYWSRLFPDMLNELRWWKIADQKDQDIAVKVFAWLFPFLWVITFLFLKLPGVMVLIGGVIGSVLLLVVVYVAIQFRTKNASLDLDSGLLSKSIFWISVVSIVLISSYGIFKIV